jgi:hypothetical protein
MVTSILPVSGFIYNPINSPFGPTEGYIGVEYTFYFIIPNNFSDGVLIQWFWGDGNISEWLGPFVTGTNVSASHTWNAIGTFGIKVKLKDMWGAEEFSDLWIIQILPAPILAINKISGFLWKIGAEISNKGLCNATNVSWAIFTQNGASPVLFGQGTIPQLAPGTHEDIKVINRTMFGLGWFKIIVKVQCDDTSTVEKQEDALAFFFFILYTKK